ncbi:hypothetical protein ACA910_002773 [Epithemia clementina (nom. ined.)]
MMTTTTAAKPEALQPEAPPNNANHGPREEEQAPAATTTTTTTITAPRSSLVAADWNRDPETDNESTTTTTTQSPLPPTTAILCTTTTTTTAASTRQNAPTTTPTTKNGDDAGVVVLADSSSIVVSSTEKDEDPKDDEAAPPPPPPPPPFLSLALATTTSSSPSSSPPVVAKDSTPNQGQSCQPAPVPQQQEPSSPPLLQPPWIRSSSSLTRSNPPSDDTLLLEDGWKKIRVQGIEKVEALLEQQAKQWEATAAGSSSCGGDEPPHHLPEQAESGALRLVRITNVFTPSEYMNLYTVAYDMCTQPPPYNWSWDLYDRYGETMQVYLRTKVVPVLQRKQKPLLLLLSSSSTSSPFVAPPAPPKVVHEAGELNQTNDEETSGRVVGVVVKTSPISRPHHPAASAAILASCCWDFLQELSCRWNNHVIMVKSLKRIFIYLEGYHIKKFALSSFDKVGVQCFQDTVLEACVQSDLLVPAILHLLDQEQRGCVPLGFHSPETASKSHQPARLPFMIQSIVDMLQHMPKDDDNNNNNSSSNQEDSRKGLVEQLENALLESTREYVATIVRFWHPVDISNKDGPLNTTECEVQQGDGLSKAVALIEAENRRIEKNMLGFPPSMLSKMLETVQDLQVTLLSKVVSAGAQQEQQQQQQPPDEIVLAQQQESKIVATKKPRMEDYTPAVENEQDNDWEILQYDDASDTI